MARQEHDREDILREATALVERVELAIPGHTEPTVIGFRRNGSLSIFFGADPVYQFNTRGALRRGFIAGRLVKADAHALWSMTRQRTRDAVNLLSEPLTAAETDVLLQQLHDQLDTLRAALATGTVHVSGRVPYDIDPLPRIRQWLEQHRPPIQLADRPHVA